jgi:outer membrane protein
MINKIASSLIVVTLLSVFAVPSVFAEGTRVAFVNVPKVLEEAPQAVAANTRLEKEFEPRNRSLIAMRKQLRKNEDRLAKEGITMSQAQRRKLELDIRDAQREIKRSQEDYREDLNIRRNEELRKLQKHVYKAIVTLAEREKIDIVLGDNVIHAGKNVDITRKVLEVLQSQIKSAPSGNGKAN